VGEQDYKEAGDLIQDLVDVVSKNGALLLNVGPRPDGTIPEPEQDVLREIGRWLDINGDAIYGTRPWRAFGEGPTEIPEGDFSDTKRKPFTGRDFRFTTRDEILYAIALAWPGAQASIISLADGSPLCPETIVSVRMLGVDGELDWTRDAEALRVTLPEQPPCEHAYALEIHLRA
jgi:alpha-L-fucosidase